MSSLLALPVVLLGIDREWEERLVLCSASPVGVGTEWGETLDSLICWSYQWSYWEYIFRGRSVQFSALLILLQGGGAYVQGVVRGSV